MLGILLCESTHGKQTKNQWQFRTAMTDALVLLWTK